MGTNLEEKSGDSQDLLTTTLEEFLSFYTELWASVGLAIELILIFGLIGALYTFRASSFMVFVEMFFEKVYEFFEEILGWEEKKWTKMYIVGMFFIILISNIIGMLLEFVSNMMGVVKEGTNLALAHPDAIGAPILEHFYVKIPTADINFNIAMAIVGVMIVIYEQFKFLGFGKALYEYVPILWKNYIPFERGNLPKYIDLPVFILVKAFDIMISMFLWLLEIVGHGAKIISLSFRLFGNVTSGWLLMVMLVGAVSALTQNLFTIDFPIIAPIILHLQALLVAFIQALVFPLLIAIFIKVAKVH